MSKKKKRKPKKVLKVSRIPERKIGGSEVSEGSDADSGQLQEYFENLCADAEDCSSKEQDSEGEVQAEASAFAQSAVNDIGSGPSVEYSSPQGDGASEDSSLADSEGNDEGSEGPCVSDVLEDFGQILQLHEQYPVQAKGQLKPGLFQGESKSNRDQSLRGSSPKRNNRWAGEAHRRKLQNVDKRQLRRRHVLEKRAARAALQGLDVERINDKLHEFVLRGGDMEAFESMEKPSREIVRRLASFYGLKASEQSGSGKKRFIVVRATHRSALPQGDDQAKLASLLGDFKAARLAEINRRSHHPRLQTPVRKLPGGNSLIALRKPEVPGTKAPVNFTAGGCIQAAMPDRVVIVDAASALRTRDCRRLCPEGSILELTQNSARPSVMPQTADFASTAILPNDSARSFGLGAVNRSDPAAGLGFDRRSDDAIDHLPALGTPERPLWGDSSPPTCQREADAEMAVVREDPSPSTESHFGLGFPQEVGHECDEATISPGSHKHKVQPSLCRTKAEYKRMRKKQDKETRRAVREGLSGQTDSGAPDYHAFSNQVALQYGDFERHTKGIGSKIMAQMGFMGQGSGLGKDKQGIPEPLKAVARPKKLGLGA